MKVSRDKELILAWSANTDPRPLTKEERSFYNTLLQSWIEKAEAGDVQLQFDLGVKYLEGVLIPSDYTEAVYWLKRAVNGGDSDAMECLASLYWLGCGVDQDYEIAKDFMQKAAEQGSAQAQFELGRMHFHGLGTAPNPANAFQWFHIAACNKEERERYQKSYVQRIGPMDSFVNEHIFTQNDVRAAAQYEVGHALASGCGVKQDSVAAKRWFEAAANRGHARSQCELGMLIAQGVGGRDMVEAISWWEKAAKGGVGEAALNAAIAYAQGDEVPQDISKAKEWAHVAASSGLARGYLLLGNLEMENAKDFDGFQRAKDFFILAANKGDADAQYSVGVACHRFGILLQKQDSAQTDQRAFANTCFGSQPDLIQAILAQHKEALFWFYLAEKNGSQFAPEMVDFLEEHLGDELVRAVRAYQAQFF